MADLDNLEIKISADASKANRALNSLVSGLTGLSTALSTLDSGKLDTFTNSLSGLANGMKQLQGVSKPDYNRVVKGLKKFEEIDTSKFSGVANSLVPFSQSLQSMTSLDTSGLNRTVNALTRLANSNITTLQGADFSRVGSSLVTLVNSLQGAGSVERNTVYLVSSMAKLASTGASIGIVANTLPTFSSALRTFINSMANVDTVAVETISFANAIGVLANAGTKTAQTASNLSILAVELKKFMQVMATAPSVSRNVLAMTQALSQLASNGRRVGTITRQIGSGFNTMGRSASRASKHTTSLASAIGKLYAKCWIFIKIFRQLKKAIDISSSLTELQNVIDHTFGGYQGKLEDFTSTSIEMYGMSEQMAKKIATRYQAMGVAMGYSAKNMSDMSIELTKLAGDMASFYDVSQESVAEDLESIFTGMTRPLRTYGLDLTEATLKEWALKNGMDANIDSMSQAEKTMLRYKYVMAQTSAAQGDFARTSDTWHNQLVILKNLFIDLGKVIGTAFINMLKPVISVLNTIVKAVTSFAEKIVNALGVIFGWELEISNGGLTEEFEDSADYAEDLESGLGGASKKAKELKQQLQGFDELNVLSTPDDSNGSGGSGSAGIGGGADTGDNDLSWQIKKRKGAFESEIDNLYDLGKYISSTLTKSMNDIDWNEVYQGAKDFGKGLADFLNGLINPDLFGAVGRTIAGSLNTAIYSALSFSNTFDWVNLGNSVATGINNFFETFDSKAFGQGVNSLAHGILDALSVAISNTDWEKIGDSLADLINEIDVGELFIDFAYIALSLIKGIGDAIVKLGEDNPIAAAIVTLLIGMKLTSKLAPVGSAIASAISTSLGGTEATKKIGTGLKNAFSSLLGSSYASNVGAILGDFSLFGAATAGEIAGALAVSIPAALAAAFVGFSFGQWLYENTDIGTVSDYIVGLVLPEVKTESGDTTRKDLAKQQYDLWHGKSNVSDIDLQNYITALGDAFDYATSMGYSASEAIAYAHITAIDAFSDMVGDEQKVANEYELYGATYNRVNKSMSSTTKKTSKEISKSVVNEVMAFKEGKTTMESLSTSAKENLPNVSKYVKEYLDFKQGKISFEGLSSGARQAFSSIDGYVRTNKLTTQDLARQYGISYESMSTTVDTTMKNVANYLMTGGDNAQRIASEKGLSTKNAYVTGLNGMPSEVANKLSGVSSTVSNSLNTSNTAKTKSVDTKNAYLSGLNGMPSEVANKLSGISSTVNNSLDGAKSSASTKSNELKGAVLSGFNGMPSEVAERMAQARSQITGQDWSSAGSNLTAGLGNGIKNSWTSNVLNRVVDLAKTLTSKLKSTFGIKSPSRVWRDQIGAYLPEGLALGIEKTSDYAVGAAETLATDVTEAMQGALNNPFDTMKADIDGFNLNGNYNSTISATMSDDLANSQKEQNNLLREQNSLLSQILDKDTSISASDVFNAVKKSNRQYYNQTGRNALVF